MIKQYNNENIPRRLSNLFGVSVECVLVATEEFIDIITRVLSERHYEYKLVEKGDNIIFGIQFRRVG